MVATGLRDFPEVQESHRSRTIPRWVEVRPQMPHTIVMASQIAAWLCKVTTIQKGDCNSGPHGASTTIVVLL